MSGKGAQFKVVAFTPDDYERVIYVASPRQVHQQDATMKERVSFTQNGGGLVLDPSDYPPKTRFLLMLENPEHGGKGL
jgi:hypothetical protein